MYLFSYIVLPLSVDSFQGFHAFEVINFGLVWNGLYNEP